MNKTNLRTVIIYIIYLSVIAMFQFATPFQFSINGVRPDYLIVFSVLVSFLYGPADAIAIGIISGLIIDSFSGRSLGIGVLVCIYCGLIATVFLRKHISKNIFMGLIQVIVATLTYTVVLSVMSFLLYPNSGNVFEYVFLIMKFRFPSLLLLNGISSIVIYYLLYFFSPYKKERASIPENDYALGELIWK
jgi:rod shape-determining protein MreD